MKKFLSSLILVVVLLASLTGCSSNDSGGSGEESQEKGELTKITVSEPVRGVLWAPVHLAKELGFFEDEGLDVDVVTVQGDAPTAPVLSGDAQFGLFGPEMILGFNEKGEGTKLIITATQKFPYTFFSASEYETIESLKGSAVNGADSGSSPRQFVRTVLKSGGLDPDEDASYLTIPNSGMVAALENGDVNATYASPESRQILVDAGANILVDMYKPEVHKEILNSETYEMYITFAKDEYIKENPETVQKYVNAVYKAILWLNAHSVEEVAEALKPSFSDNPNLESNIREMMDNDIFSSTGDFTDSGFEAINNMAKESGVIENDVKKEDVVEDSFLKKAHETITLD